MAKEKEPAKNLYQRMLAVMEDVKYIQKAEKKLNGMYSFVTHDSVTRALHDPLVKHGILMIPNVREMRQEGNRTVAVVDVAFVNAESPTETISVTYHGYGIDSQDKGPGKAISYAVKYALLKVFCLETGDDPERDSIEYEAPKKITPRQVKYLKYQLGEDKDLLEQCLRFAAVKILEDISIPVFADLVLVIEEQKLKKGKKQESSNG